MFFWKKEKENKRVEYQEHHVCVCVMVNFTLTIYKQPKQREELLNPLHFSCVSKQVADCIFSMTHRSGYSPLTISLGKHNTKQILRSNASFLHKYILSTYFLFSHTLSLLWVPKVLLSLWLPDLILQNSPHIHFLLTCYLFHSPIIHFL